MIPDFNAKHGVVPPWTGLAEHPTSTSPYECSMEEIAKKLCFTPKRKHLVRALIAVRKEIRQSGLIGYHWIAGSFIEAQGPDVNYPDDLDAIFFLKKTSWESWDRLEKTLPELLDGDSSAIRERFSLDPKIVDLEEDGENLLVAVQRFWA